MVSRRGLLSLLGATWIGQTLPGRSLAQTPDTPAPEAPPKPLCFKSKRFEDWTAVSQTSFKDGQTSGSSRLVTRATDSVIHMEGFEAEETLPVTRKGSFEISGPTDSPRMKLTFPRGKLIATETPVNKEFLAGRTASAGIFVDDLSVATISAFNDFTYSSGLPDWLLAAIEGGQRVQIDMKLDDAPLSSMAFSMAGYSDAVAARNDLHAGHFAEVEEAQGCTVPVGGVPCVMTTATVSMLGRSDSCFELQQMRRIRAYFMGHAAHERVIEDYVAVSQDLLERKKTIGFKVRLLAFYAGIVWPTALLARCGFMTVAGKTYLFGFGLLKRSFGLPNSNLLDP